MGTSFRSAPWPDVCFFSSLQLEQKRLSERKSKPNVSQRGQGSIFGNHSCFVQTGCHWTLSPNFRSKTFLHASSSWTCYPGKHSVYNNGIIHELSLKNETFCFSLSLLRLDMRFGNQNMDSRCSEVSFPVPLIPTSNDGSLQFPVSLSPEK